MNNHAVPLVAYIVGTLLLVLAAFGLASSDDFNLAYLGLAFLGGGLAADCAAHRR